MPGHHFGSRRVSALAKNFSRAALFLIYAGRRIGPDRCYHFVPSFRGHSCDTPFDTFHQPRFDSTNPLLVDRIDSTSSRVTPRRSASVLRRIAIVPITAWARSISRSRPLSDSGCCGGTSVEWPESVRSTSSASRRHRADSARSHAQKSATVSCRVISRIVKPGLRPMSNMSGNTGRPNEQKRI